MIAESPWTTWILLRADEGHTGELYVSPTLDGLRTLIQTSYDAALAELPMPVREDDQPWLVTHRDALLAMLADVPADLTPDRYRLTPHDPWYEQWTLVYATHPLASDDDHRKVVGGGTP